MTYDSWKARNYQDDYLDDAGLEHAEADYQDEQLLIGPLAHIKHRSAFGFDYYTVDFSRPGALDRYATEEGQWWSKNWDKDSLS